MHAKLYSCLGSFKNNAILFATRAKHSPICSVLTVALVVASLALTIFAIVGCTPFTISWALIPLIFALSPLLIITSDPSGDEKMFELFKKAHTLEQVKGDSLVLVLTAKDDHNNALQVDQRTLFKRLEKEGKHQLLFAEVEKIQDIKQTIITIRESGKKIKGLWLKAHGSPDSISLGKSPIPLETRRFLGCMDQISCSNVGHLEGVLQELEPEAPIVLYSCSTAKPAVQDNIAFLMSLVAAGRKVYAAKSTNSHAGFSLKNPQTLEVKFYKYRKVDGKGLFKRLKKTFCKIMLTFTPPSRPFSSFHRDITAVFINGMPVP